MRRSVKMNQGRNQAERLLVEIIYIYTTEAHKKVVRKIEQNKEKNRQRQDMVHSEREKKEVVRERICLHQTHWKLKKERGQWINLRQVISEQSQGENMSVQEACTDMGYSSSSPAKVSHQRRNWFAAPGQKLGS